MSKLSNINVVRWYFECKQLSLFIRLFTVIIVCSVACTCAKTPAKPEDINAGGESHTRQLKALTHKGKPFFPIGAYGRSRPARGRGP